MRRSNNEPNMSIKNNKVGDRKIIRNKYSFAILSLTHIFKLAIIITYIQYGILQMNYQVLCRSRGVIYNKDGKFIYKPAKSSQGHIIVIEDRHPEGSSRNVLPQAQTSSPLFSPSAYQPIQLIAPRAYQQPSMGIESASSVSPIRAAGIYSNGQIQLINLNDLQGLVAAPSPSPSPSPYSHSHYHSQSPSHASLARVASESFIPSNQQVIVPLIQLYHPSKYHHTSSLSERPYNLINVPGGSPLSMANIGINNPDYDRLNHEHNPILDNGAPVITPGQYNSAPQNYQQHHVATAASQAQGQPLQSSNQHSTRPRSDADSFDNSAMHYDHQHERHPLSGSAFIDDALAEHVLLPQSDDIPITRPHPSDSKIRSKITDFQELSSDGGHIVDISDGGQYETSNSNQHPSRSHKTDISNLSRTVSHDGARGIFGRSALPSLMNLNNLSSQSNSSHINNSSKDHVTELEDGNKKSSLNLDTLTSKSKLLKNSKRNSRNKSKQLNNETRKIDNHFKQSPTSIDVDLNSKDMRGNQYWNQFKDQFEIM